MRKALLPMIACLALCGGATAALIVTTAHAQPEPRKPMMVAQAAQPAPPPGTPHGMGPRGMEPRGMGRPMPDAAAMAAHFKQMCNDGYAREAGELAYTEAKLALAPAEQALFARWKTVKLDIAKRRAESCTAHERPRQARMPSLVDRMAREQDMLKRRLADLDAERPVLEAFYNALSPEQKNEFGHGMHDRMMGHRMFAGGPPGMMGHHMGHEMMGPEGGPPDAPGNAPPGPPPQ